jgi:hypothetical protein
MTGGLGAADRRRFSYSSGDQVAIRKWDASYALRARRWGTFLVCRALFLALHSPPALAEDRLLAIFQHVPGTQTPPKITPTQMADLLALADHSLHAA